MAVVAQRYRLDRELGTGGTATVWLAHDVVLDRPCAVKILKPAEREAAARRERLKTEARALAALDHDCVVRIYDLGQHDGQDYIVMEYLERGSLADRLALEGPLAPTEAVDAVIEVLGALQAAHAAGIIHRDVKPGNVLIRADGAAALCDFGIARTATPGTAGRTETGVALGSIGYMAPEQRLDARRAGPSADLYAAACTLFNLVTNDTPVDLYLARDTSPRWEAVPTALRPVLRRATRSEPSARFADADEMAAALRDVRPALVGVPPARSLAAPIAEPHPETQAGPEPSTEAELRIRAVDADGMGWAHRERAPVGRTALWVGLSVMGVATALGLAMGPLRDATSLDRLLPPPDPAPEGAPRPAALKPAGTWQGSFGDNRGTLVLTGPAGAVAGEMSLELGSHTLRTRVTGRVEVWAEDGDEGQDDGGGGDEAAGEVLVLIEAASEQRPAKLVLRPHTSGLILEGRLHRRTDAPIPVALVRTR